MYLKRMDISGFKSFPDPSTMIFDKGVTSVVGPNGCGKTNILDALRWVLGEQRPRLLRGGRMEEVIFSGTRQRPPLNMAEITLTIDNSSGRLPLPYTEISVARRLFRSGESEYLLNNTPCRLKDITELFSDTGMGSHSYAVIGQGMIDALLSENPDDRRFLFEEAAGISKYKSRKKEAINKLKATENDLLRIHDIQVEVEQRVKALRVQVYRAKRYQKIADELAGIEWEKLLSEYRVGKHELAEVLNEFNNAASILGAHTTDLTHAETELEQARLSMDEAEAHSSEISEALNRAVAAAHEAETELVRDRERRESMVATIGRLESEIEERTERAKQWTQQEQQLRTQSGELETANAAHQQETAEAEKRFTGEDEALKSIRQQRESLADRLRDGERSYGEFRADLTYRAEQAEALAKDKTELSSRIAQTGDERRATEEKITDCRTQKNAVLDELETVEQELRQTSADIADRTKKITAIKDQIGNSEKTLSGKQAQAETLAGVLERGEGLGRGTEAILRQKDMFSGEVDGWVQRISAPDDRKAALESLLAGMIGALWCATPEAALQVHGYLQDNEVGQACFWDPSLPVPHSTTWERPPVTDKGFLGWLIDDCQVDANVRPMAEVLLFSAMLADTPESARRIFRHFSGEYAVASLDGTAFVPPGLIYAGRGGQSVLGRADLLEQLRSEIEEESARLAEFEQEQKRLTDELDRLERQNVELRATKDRLTTSLNQLELELGREQTRQTEVIRRLDEFSSRLETVKAGLAEAESRRTAALAGQSGWEEDRSKIARELESANEQLAQQETRHRAALNQLNEKRMAGVELSGRIERLSEELARLEEMIRENAETITRQENELAAIREEKERLTGNISERETAWADLLAEKDELNTKRNAAFSELNEKKEAYLAREKTVRAFRKERDESEAAQHRLEMKRAEVSGRVDQLVQRAADNFEKTPDELDNAVVEFPESKIVNDDDIAALKTKLERIGPVNLLALEEYDRENERLTFLNSQIDDLSQAKTALNKTINELNRSAGERFLATFESARLNFQSVFTDLFQGGEADVRLSDPENPLESPIEIYARPRGKKALGIRHLSGGERALTAIAMLFGLYLIKPSPFCILDEIDAPLDDSNTTRFLRLIARFKSKTQFVLITHNKLTMESADNLYGVTMEQPGVSMLVSVRLNPDQPEGERLFSAVQSGTADDPPTRILVDANGPEDDEKTRE